ncbi:hypothetical protein PIB30_073897 [Stylosanthes scabra]|uniref:Uncharacterized protein n=1 Tax=Stylosanthes scabra TaxID=79078 RepID=A0ABU6QPM8_9FABA|nr:hypothetical protein [Stylosanthes scabra]
MNPHFCRGSLRQPQPPSRPLHGHRCSLRCCSLFITHHGEIESIATSVRRRSIRRPPLELSAGFVAWRRMPEEGKEGIEEGKEREDMRYQIKIPLGDSVVLHSKGFLQGFKGIPHPYDKTKTEVIHDALKVLRLQKGPKFCLLGTGEEEEEREGAFVVKRRKQLRVKAEKVAKEKLVAKPLVADSSAKSHELSLAYERYSLQKLEPPLVLQEFVNHVVSSPEIVKEFLKTHESTFSNHLTLSAIDYITYGSKGMVFAPYGSYWKFLKKLCMSELLGGRTLDRFLPLRREETLRFLKALQKKGEARESVDISGELITLTNNVISRMTMSVRCCEEGANSDDTEKIREMVKEVMELAGKLNNISDFIWLFKNWNLQGMNKRLKKVRERFDSMMERIIREHELVRKEKKEKGDNNGGGKVRDLLDILLEIHEDNQIIDEIQFTMENIKAFILELFISGTDTSATTIEWALAELINNPHVMKKARQEIDSVTANNKLIQESDVANLPYLQAIIKEILRLHPVVPLFNRQSTETSIICGYKIASKTTLFTNLWSMGRDPKIWKNPLEFRPERFIDEERQLLDLRGKIFNYCHLGLEEECVLGLH